MAARPRGRGVAPCLWGPGRATPGWVTAPRRVWVSRGRRSSAGTGRLYNWGNVDRSRSHLNYRLGRESYDFGRAPQSIDGRIAEAREANP